MEQFVMDIPQKPKLYNNQNKYAVLMTRTAPYEYLVHQVSCDVTVGDKRLLSTDLSTVDLHVIVLGVYESFERAHFVKRTIEGCNEEQNLSNLVHDMSGIVNQLRSVSEQIQTPNKDIINSPYSNNSLDRKFSPIVPQTPFIDKSSTTIDTSMCSSMYAGAQTPNLEYVYYDLPATSTPQIETIPVKSALVVEGDDHEPLNYSVVELIAGLAKLYHLPSNVHRDSFFAKLLALLLFKGEQCSRKEDKDKWNWLIKNVFHFFPTSHIPDEAEHIREHRISSAVFKFCQTKKKKTVNGKKIKDNTQLLADIFDKFHQSTVSDGKNPKLRYRSVPSFNFTPISLRNKKVDELKPCRLESPGSISLASITCSDILSKSVIHSSLFSKEQILLLGRKTQKRFGVKSYVKFAASLAEKIMDAKRSRVLSDEEKQFVYQSTRTVYNKNKKCVENFSILDREVEAYLRK